MRSRSWRAAIALVLVYLVMAALFESLLHPFAIMFALPFAFVGIAWISFLTGSPFNLMVQIGLLPLAVGQNQVGDVLDFPLARTVIAGLAAATLLTLILVPCLDTLIEGGAGLVARVWRSGPRSRPRVPGAVV